MAKPKATAAAAQSGGTTANTAGNQHQHQDRQQDHQQLTESFVRAFDKERSTLAGFARCFNLEELHVVRDGFYLGMAKDLCPDEYKRVLVMVLKRKFGSGNGNENTNDSDCYDTGIVPGENQGMLSMSFEEMVLAARVCDDDNEIDNDTDNDNISNNTNTNESDEINNETTTVNKTPDQNNNAAVDVAAATTKTTSTRYWKDLLEALFRIAETVGSELESSVWKTLEDGRMNWLRAVSAAHPIKTILQKALALESKSETNDNNVNTSDAMMVWIYTICVHLTTTTAGAAAVEEEDDIATTTTTTQLLQLKRAVDDWVVAVDMTDRFQPLKNYQAELWDPRRDEWRPLDVGAQEAADRGGADLLEAWKA